MKMKNIIFLCIFSVFVFASCSFSIAAEGESEKITVTADDFLEWYRDENKFKAQGNVIVTQDKTTIQSDRMEAIYRDRKESGFEILSIIANGNVVISDKKITAKGGRAVYDTASEKLTVSEGNPVLFTQDGTVNAQNGFEYSITEGILTASGGVTAKHQGNILSAETAKAIFADNPQGKKEIKLISAKNNVVIVTENEKLTGDEGVYNVKSKKAEISGNVIIQRGKSILRGDKGEIDLNTNISRLSGGGAERDDGRVKGVFYPNSAE